MKLSQKFDSTFFLRHSVDYKLPVIEQSIRQLGIVYCTGIVALYHNVY